MAGGIYIPLILNWLKDSGRYSFPLILNLLKDSRRYSIPLILNWLKDGGRYSFPLILNWLKDDPVACRALFRSVMGHSSFNQFRMSGIMPG